MMPETNETRFTPAPSLEALPAGWTLRFNWKAFLTPADWEQARRVELSGSLDDWLDPRESVYE